MRAGLGLLALVALFALSLSLRSTTAPLVLHDDGVHLTVPGDPYYHLRRIAFNVARFPAALDADPYLNFPDGAPAVWPATFDWGSAAVIRAVVGGHDRVAAERAAVRVPPILGALTVVAVAALAWWRFGVAAGLTAGLLLALLPVHLLHSQLGQLDHHVAVALLSVALVAAGFALLAPERGARIGAGVVFGAVQAGAILVWPGALLHAVAAMGVPLLWLLFARERSDAVARGAALAAACGTAAILLAPMSLGRSWNEFGAWTPLALSNFQPVFFGALALALLGLAALWRGTAAGASRAHRVGIAAGLGALALAGALAWIPGLAEAVTYAAGWFGKEEEFQTLVSELRPFDAVTGVSRFSILWLLFPLAWLWLAWRTARKGHPADGWLLLSLAAGFGVLTLMQRRFGNSFSVLFVLLWGAVAAEALRAWPVRRSARIACTAGAVLLLLLTADSLWAFHQERNATTAQAARNPTLSRRGPLGVRHRLVDAGATWLGAHSPPTRGWLDPSLQPEYGVLCAWDAGHMVRYRAQRPVVADNFGVYGGRANYEAMGRYFAADDEDEAIAILSALGVRYVLADRAGAAWNRSYAPDSMTARLALRFGSDGDDGEPGLARHRLLWHQRSGREAELAAAAPGFALGVWEPVPGARVRGRGAPDARFEVRYPLRTEAGRAHVYRRVVQVDAAGHYEFTVPYPTDQPWSEAIEGAPAYRLAGAFGERTLQVPEGAIAAGAVVAGPELLP